MEDFNENPVLKFYKDMVGQNQDDHHRYKSWEHCYKFFQENHENFRGNDKLIDPACLHLSFYLASWGMYRGSGFLLNKDYRCHKYALEVLIKEKYDELWDLKFKTLTENDDKINLIFDLKDKIKRAYISKLKEAEKVKYLFELDSKKYKKYLEKEEIDNELVKAFKENINEKTNISSYSIEKEDNKVWRIYNDKKSRQYRIEENGKNLKVYQNQRINPTPTLISKILMGTMGCVPAYDRLFIEGLKKEKHNNNFSSFSFNEKSFEELVKFYKKNKGEIENIQKYISNNEITYPIMKLIDMYFWYIGFMNPKDKK